MDELLQIYQRGRGPEVRAAMVAVILERASELASVLEWERE